MCFAALQRSSNKQPTAACLELINQLDTKGWSQMSRCTERGDGAVWRTPRVSV